MAESSNNLSGVSENMWVAPGEASVPAPRLKRVPAGGHFSNRKRSDSAGAMAATDKGSSKPFRAEGGSPETPSVPRPKGSRFAAAGSHPSIPDVSFDPSTTMQFVAAWKASGHNEGETSAASPVAADAGVCEEPKPVRATSSVSTSQSSGSSRVSDETIAMPGLMSNMPASGVSRDRNHPASLPGSGRRRVSELNLPSTRDSGARQAVESLWGPSSDRVTDDARVSEDDRADATGKLVNGSSNMSASGLPETAEYIAAASSRPYHLPSITRLPKTPAMEDDSAAKGRRSDSDDTGRLPRSGGLVGNPFAVSQQPIDIPVLNSAEPLVLSPVGASTTSSAQAFPRNGVGVQVDSDQEGQAAGNAARLDTVSDEGHRKGDGGSGTGRRRGRKIASTLLIVLGIALLALSAFIFVRAQMGYQEAQATYADLQQHAVQDSSGDGVPQVDFDALAAINPDVIGWIYVPNTVINYPVVHTGDNTTYLSRLFDLSGNGSGTIFMDMDGTAPGAVDQQTTLYGHHMYDNTMFKIVDDTLKQDAFDAFGNVYYITRENTYVFKPLFTAQVMDTYTDARVTNFTGDPSLTQYLQDMLGQAKAKAADAEERIGSTDKVLSLVTCAGEIIPRTTRAVMVCSLEETIERQ